MPNNNILFTGEYIFIVLLLSPMSYRHITIAVPLESNSKGFRDTDSHRNISSNNRVYFGILPSEIKSHKLFFGGG